MNAPVTTFTPLAEDSDAIGCEASVAIPVPEVPLLVFSRLLQGDQRLLEKLALSEADLYILRSLPAESLPRLLSRSACGGIVEVYLHRRALHTLLRHLKTDSGAENEIRRMIEAEASHPFMKHFYNIPYPIYHQYRQQAGLLRSAGRPSRPESDAVNHITELLQKLNLLLPSVAVGPFDFLAIHHLTGQTLRNIWSVYLQATAEKNTEKNFSVIGA